MIEAVQLTRRYGSLPAVDSLSLQVAPGQLFCFLGPNGAGKTTTIKMLVGLLKPNSGHARVAGLDVWADPVRAKAALGYVPDAVSLYSELTGLEFLDLVADIYRVGASDRVARIGRLAGLFSLTAHLGQPMSSYSRGMRQKATIIAAMLHEPAALFLDEPTVGLDPRSARTLKDLLREACDRGAAVLMSTHILEVAETMADQVGIIHHGKLLFQGSVPELREYQHGPESSSLEDLFLQLTQGDQPAAEKPGPEVAPDA